MKKHFSTGAIASAIARERIPPLCVAALAQESNPRRFVSRRLRRKAIPAAAPACGKRFGRFVSMTSSSLPPLPDVPAQAASHIRWRVVGLLSAMAALTYVDRLNLGIVGKYLEEEFQLSTQTMGWILG